MLSTILKELILCKQFVKQGVFESMLYRTFCYGLGAENRGFSKTDINHFPFLKKRICTVCDDFGINE